MFIIFFIFLLVFLEFSITRRVGTKRNCNFYFLHSSAFSNLFWLGINPQWYFFDFLIFFFSFFGIFYYLSGKNGTERQFLFFLFLSLLQSILAWNEAITISFNFLKFFAIFSEFSIALWVGTKRNDNFYFLSSLAFSNLFWLEMTP